MIARSFWAVVILIASAIAGSCHQPVASAESLIEFCHLEIDGMHRSGSGDYQVKAAFDVKAGQPSNIRITYDRLEIGEAARTCIGRWRVGFIPDGTEVSTMFQWRHGIGWTLLELTWLGQRLRVPLSGQLHPYFSSAPIPADLEAESPRFKGK